MNNGFVSGLSRVVEWVLSLYQDAVTSLLGLVTGTQTGGGLQRVMNGWKGLFALLIIAGVALNLIIYVIRWKPHWWWFARRRMVVDDALLNEKERSGGKNGKKSAKSASRSVKPSTIVPRKDASDTLSLSTKAPERSIWDEEEDLMEAHPKKRRGG